MKCPKDGGSTPPTSTKGCSRKGRPGDLEMHSVGPLAPWNGSLGRVVRSSRAATRPARRSPARSARIGTRRIGLHCWSPLSR